MPLESIADLERRVRHLEMELDQSKHRFVDQDRTVNTAPPSERIVWKKWTPTFSGWTGAVRGVFRSIQIGKLVIDSIMITAGTSIATYASVGLSHTSANIPNKVWDGACGMCTANGTILYEACRWEVAANSNVVTFYGNMGDGAWSPFGSKLIRAIVIYEVA